MSNHSLHLTSDEELLSKIKQVVTEVLQNSSFGKKSEETNTIFTIDQASSFLGLSKPTIYYYTSKNLIPFMKRGKRIYFSKLDLHSWLQAGRQKTISERMEGVNIYLSQGK